MRRRALVWPVVALAHAAVLGVALFGPVAAAPAPPVAALSLIAVAAPAVAPPPALPPIVESAITTPVAAPEFAVEPVAAPESAGCELAGDIETALRQNLGVPLAVGLIPATARSVANSLILWNGQWISAGAVGGDAALLPIQRIVRDRISNAPAGCQAATIVGPRLLMVPEGNGMIVLAFGSGVWSWSQLLVRPDVSPNSSAVAKVRGAQATESASLRSMAT